MDEKLRARRQGESLLGDLIAALGYNELAATDRPLYLLMTSNPSILRRSSYQVLRITWKDCGMVNHGGRLKWDVHLRADMRSDLRKSLDVIQLGAKSLNDTGNFSKDIFCTLKAVNKRDKISGFIDVVSNSNFVCNSTLWHFEVLQNCTYKRGNYTEEKFDRIAPICNTIFNLYLESIGGIK